MNGMDRGTNLEESGTAAERVALDVTKVKQGTEFYETDTTARYKFLSGAWVLGPSTGGAIPGFASGGGGGGGNVTIVNPTSAAGNVQVASLYFPNSTGNNTTAQLAAGATFTGTVETVLSLQAAQIEIVCDQAYTLVVNQYIDAAGTQKSGSRTFTKTAGTPTNVNLLLPGNYFNLTLTNNGGSTTTTLVVNTTFGIMDSVDDTGRLMVNTPQAAPYTNQQRATAAVVALPNVPLLNGAAIIASTTNAGPIMCGLIAGLTGANDGTGTGYQLNPGQPFPGLAITNLNQLGIIAATGNTSLTDFICMAAN